MKSEIKQICLKCEYNIHCQNKCCAFRSLGNEYCEEVENVNNLIKDLQLRIDKTKRVSLQLRTHLSNWLCKEGYMGGERTKKLLDELDEILGEKNGKV